MASKVDVGDIVTTSAQTTYNKMVQLSPYNYKNNYTVLSVGDGKTYPLDYVVLGFSLNGPIFGAVKLETLTIVQKKSIKDSIGSDQDYAYSFNESLKNFLNIYKYNTINTKFDVNTDNDHNTHIIIDKKDTVDKSEPFLKFNNDERFILLKNDMVFKFSTNIVCDNSVSGSFSCRFCDKNKKPLNNKPIIINIFQPYEYEIYIPEGYRGTCEYIEILKIGINSTKSSAILDVYNFRSTNSPENTEVVDDFIVEIEATEPVVEPEKLKVTKVTTPLSFKDIIIAIPDNNLYHIILKNQSDLTIRLEGATWVSDDPGTIPAGSTYEISILNGTALYIEI